MMSQACIERHALGVSALKLPLLSRETPEQKNTQHDKKNIREPDEQFRVCMRIPAQRVANDHEQEVSRGNNQPHGEAN